VKQETKLPFILECIQRTEPQVIIFCENIKEVDDIHEYLLLKGIKTTGIHSEKN